MNFKLIMALLVAFVSVVSFSHANEFETGDFYISGVTYTSEKVVDKIGLVILNNDKFQNNDELQLRYDFNNETLANNCRHSIIFNDDNSYQKKVYCPIPYQSENGVYTVYSKIVRGDSTLVELEPFTFFYDSNTTFSNLVFRVTPQGTQITIHLPENLEEGDLIYHDIPLSAVGEITDENMATKIQSDREFIIVQENPIIAWEVSSKEEKIEYTLLNTTLDEEQKAQFATYKKEQDSISTIIIFSIVVLLIIIFAPFILKSRKK